MLVYANYLELTGNEAYKGVFSAIVGWIKRTTKQTIRITDLLGSKKFNCENLWITTETACKTEPSLYSIVIKHPDSDVKGRQWILEVGICVKEGITGVSIALRTDEISTLVNSHVYTTRPKIIEYIANNEQLVPQTIGTSVKALNDDSDAYKSLLADIERKDRNYPIVLVSPQKDGTYLVDTDRLQQQLLGLGQVVKISEDCNSYEMARILNQRFSAWDGAINVIYTPFQSGTIRTKLYLSQFITENYSQPHALISFLLSSITHNTNIPNIRKHIRSDGVKAKAIKERLYEKLHSSTNSMPEDEVNELLELAAQQETQLTSEIQRIEMEKLEVEEERDNFESELTASKWKNEALKKQLKNTGRSEADINFDDLLSTACRVDEPTPSECVSIIGSLLSDKVVFLDSATKSANQSTSFKRGRMLLDMLRKLIREYLPLYLEGGDNKARGVFTNKQYAANESETVENNTDLSNARRFEYKGEQVQMWQHLKVGIADNTDLTIRVHFLIDQDEEKVIIGYCGEHLPLG